VIQDPSLPSIVSGLPHVAGTSRVPSAATGAFYTAFLSLDLLLLSSFIFPGVMETRNSICALSNA